MGTEFLGDVEHPTPLSEQLGIALGDIIQTLIDQGLTKKRDVYPKALSKLREKYPSEFSSFISPEDNLQVFYYPVSRRLEVVDADAVLLGRKVEDIGEEPAWEPFDVFYQDGEFFYQVDKSGIIDYDIFHADGIEFSDK